MYHNYSRPFSVAMGALFAATTNITANIRGKDGPLNHAVGGCAAGLLFGARGLSSQIFSCVIFAVVTVN